MKSKTIKAISFTFLFALVATFNFNFSENIFSSDVSLDNIKIMNYATATTENSDSECYNLDNYECYDGFSDGVSKCLYNTEAGTTVNCGG